MVPDKMSARVIKAHSIYDVSVGESFNLLDLQQQATVLLANAHEEATQIVVVAKREAQQIREEILNSAREIGREEGLQDAAGAITRQAEAIAELQVTDRLATALPALRAAAESLQAERDQWLMRWERTAIRLGIAIAEKLLHRQLTVRPEFATGLISDALRLAAGQPQLTVHLHPDDLAAWGGQAHQIVQSLTACADTTLVPDRNATRGSCRIETRHGEIDARVETMLHRIAEELLEE